MYFVIWEGDLTKDPLNQGVCKFPWINSARDYMVRMRSKGYECSLYDGKLLEV